MLHRVNDKSNTRILGSDEDKVFLAYGCSRIYSGFGEVGALP